MVTITKVDAFLCPVCDKAHEDKEDAKYCCWNHPRTHKDEQYFECTECGDEFATQREASECCGPPGCRWECYWCGEGYDERNDAVECCWADHTTTGERFVCTVCDETYDGDEEADACCKTIATSVVFKCGNCGVLYGKSADAEKCCP